MLTPIVPTFLYFTSFMAVFLQFVVYFLVFKIYGLYTIILKNYLLLLRVHARFLFFPRAEFFESYFFGILYRKNQPFYIFVHYLQKWFFIQKTLCNLYKLPVFALCALVTHGKSSCYDKCVPSQGNFGRNLSSRKFI